MTPTLTTTICATALGLAAFLPLSALSRADTAKAVSHSSAPNLLINGDFELGNRDFTSGYVWTGNPTTSPGQEGNYTVGTNPQTINPLGASFGDHTTGAGRMLIVNGSTNTEGQIVWAQTVPTVKPRMVYRLSFWVASWGRLENSTTATNPAQIEARINGERLSAAPVPAPQTVAQWQKVTFLWASGEEKTARIALVDRSHEFLGNDFALDDMAFQRVDVRR